LKPYNEKYKVSFIITEILQTTTPIPILKTTATIYDNNGVNDLSATAIVGVDLNQKGMQVPQQFGSASSYAKKYALGNLLLIDDTQDADATNKHEKEIKIKEVKVEEVKELKWLNKNTPEFNSAVKYIKGGGSVSAIEAKYKMTKEVKDELTK